MSKLKPFNLEQALAGKPVVTRDGRKVIRLAHFPELSASSQVYAVVEGAGTALSFSINGVSLPPYETTNDLFMAPQKKTVWVNMYNSSITGNIEMGKTTPYDSEQAAKQALGLNSSDYIGTYPIEIEL